MVLYNSFIQWLVRLDLNLTNLTKDKKTLRKRRNNVFIC